MKHTPVINSPLKGLKVLELARILAGPWAGQTLADLGADVLKIESPDGDDTRTWGPPFITNADGSQDAAYFHSCNRGKRSAVIDFSTSAGQEKIRELVKDADILIENFKRDGLKKYGLDYESLSVLNPRLIYCSITGFGQTGPASHRAGYDFIIQGLSGIMDVTGDPDGEPQKIGVAFADIFTGLYAVIGIQAALAHRLQSGKGQHLDIALLDSMIGVLANQGMNYLVSSRSPTRLGNAHPNISPYEVFPTEDNWFILAVGNDRQFEKFCAVVELDHLPQHKKFSSNASRVKNRKELSKLISSKTSNWTSYKILAALEKVNVPCSQINTVEQAFAEPQVLARRMLRYLQRPESKTDIPTIPTPIKFSNSELNINKPSPLLGKDDAKWL